MEPHLDVPPVPHPKLSDRYGLCPETGVVYYKHAHNVSYEGDYFLDEYKAQYGRTYFEDETHLRALSRRRLELLAGRTEGSLFELGCAAGYFLDEARRAGFDSVRGLEISGYAAKHARERLGLDVQTRGFLEADDAPARYDVVAAFYVIEHFAEQRTVFQKIARMLKPGGRFVFALPSVHGPLFEYDPARWEDTHPADHFADYGPGSLRKALKHYGLRLLAARPSSYHPERARGLKGSRLFRPFYKAYADFACYGDTFEGVAIKDDSIVQKNAR